MFGTLGIARFFEKGVSEYKGLQDMIPDPAPVGLDAVRWMALHELAHLVIQDNPEIKANAHGAEFKEVLKEMLETYKDFTI